MIESRITGWMKFVKTAERHLGIIMEGIPHGPEIIVLIKIAEWIGQKAPGPFSNQQEFLIKEKKKDERFDCSPSSPGKG